MSISWLLSQGIGECGRKNVPDFWRKPGLERS
jgi:hypothetical protein